MITYNIIYLICQSLPSSGIATLIPHHGMVLTSTLHPQALPPEPLCNRAARLAVPLPLPKKGSGGSTTTWSPHRNQAQPQRSHPGNKRRKCTPFTSSPHFTHPAFGTCSERAGPPPRTCCRPGTQPWSPHSGGPLRNEGNQVLDGITSRRDIWTQQGSGRGLGSDSRRGEDRGRPLSRADA